MKIKAYSQNNFGQCIELFLSNRDKYFADYELEEYKSFLSEAAYTKSYFVLIEKDEVIGCGGYIKENGEIILTWGMIRRDLHKRGYGKALTTFRVKAIREKYPNTPIIINTAQFTKGFYEKQGFRMKAFEKDGFGSGLDKYTMTT